MRSVIKDHPNTLHFFLASSLSLPLSQRGGHNLTEHIWFYFCTIMKLRMTTTLSSRFSIFLQIKTSRFSHTPRLKYQQHKCIYHQTDVIFYTQLLHCTESIYNTLTILSLLSSHGYCLYWGLHLAPFTARAVSCTNLTMKSMLQPTSGGSSLVQIYNVSMKYISHILALFK